MPTDQRPLAIFLMGPTASGKTALACTLQTRFPVELVSVDSALVYRGMDIGTAKPDTATLAKHPHALIDICDPTQTYSAAHFRDDAQRVMRDITARGHVPLLVGGTGLYFRALQQGLSALPEANAEVRERLRQESARLGWPALHARLQRHDPVAAARIGIHDAQRLQRALEVIELTGQTLSSLQCRSSHQHFPWRVLKLALLPFDRALLHARIEARFDVMLESGFLDEMNALCRRGDLHPALPSMRALGYRQGWAFLEGQWSIREFRDRVIFATRQLAKRQLTWLRGELAARAFDAECPDLESRAATAVESFLAPASAPSVPPIDFVELKSGDTATGGVQCSVTAPQPLEVSHAPNDASPG